MARNSYRSQYPRLYKTYKEVGLGQGGTTLSKREVRAAAELAGFSPSEAKQMMQIARGESGLKPGIRGDDPGGTKGWGLVQNTPGVWGESALNYLHKLGGEQALRNPIKNMKMAKFLYDSAGKSFSPWYGTRFLEGRDHSAKSVLDKGARFSKGRTARTASTHVPGVDNSALRQQLLLGYLDERNSPDALLNLAQGLEGAQDVPGFTIPGQRVRGRQQRGREVVTAQGQSVNKMLHKAVQWSKKAPSYVWGGGHGAIAKVGDGVDCSGFVSAVLGLKTPQVSGNLTQWGKPGRGKWVTVYANDGHTFMSIRDPKTKKVRWFGTSKTPNIQAGGRSTGGVSEIHPPSASYLSSFVARHPG